MNTVTQRGCVQHLPLHKASKRLSGMEVPGRRLLLLEDVREGAFEKKEHLTRQ